MYWFKWLEIFNTEKDTIKSKNLLAQSHISNTDTKLKDFRIKEAIYVYVKYLKPHTYILYNQINEQLWRSMISQMQKGVKTSCLR
jgi:hypothetical protein